MKRILIIFGIALTIDFIASIATTSHQQSIFSFIYWCILISLISYANEDTQK